MSGSDLASKFKNSKAQARFAELFALLLKYLPPNEIYSPAMEVPEAEEDVDLSLMIISEAFFESKLLSTVFEAWLFCVSHRLLRRMNPYNMFAVKNKV